MMGCHQSDRALRDGFDLGVFPGNELPGYLHLVPTGQKADLIYLQCAASLTLLPHASTKRLVARFSSSRGPALSVGRPTTRHQIRSHFSAFIG